MNIYAISYFYESRRHSKVYSLEVLKKEKNFYYWYCMGSIFDSINEVDVYYFRIKEHENPVLFQEKHLRFRFSAKRIREKLSKKKIII